MDIRTERPIGSEKRKGKEEERHLWDRLHLRPRLRTLNHSRPICFSACPKPFWIPTTEEAATALTTLPPGLSSLISNLSQLVRRQARQTPSES